MPVVREEVRQARKHPRPGRRWAPGCLVAGLLVLISGSAVVILVNPLTIEAGGIVCQVRRFKYEFGSLIHYAPEGLHAVDRQTYGETGANGFLYLTKSEEQEHIRTLRVGDQVLEVKWFRGRKALRPVYSGGRIHVVPVRADGALPEGEEP
jgi:hypothetical protein